MVLNRFWVRLPELKAAPPSFLAHEPRVPKVPELGLPLMPWVKARDVSLDRPSTHIRAPSLLSKVGLRLLFIKLRLVDIWQSSLVIKYDRFTLFFYCVFAVLFKAILVAYSGIKAMHLGSLAAEFGTLVFPHVTS